MKRTTGLLFFILGFLLKAHAVPPVLNYAGQVAVDGELYQGIGLFKFALIKGDSNATLWSNDGSSVKGSEPVKPVRINVNGGLYSVLLGNSAIKGMGTLDPSIFKKHGSVKLRVWFSDGENEFEHLKPDRPFAAVPYAFSAGTAETAGSTTIAPGSIDRKMLSRDIRADLNSSLKKITRDMLPHSVLKDLNSSIKSIKRDMLPSSVLAQLDRKLTRADLPNDVLSDINSTIKLHRLSPEVLSALQISPSISTQPFARYDRSTGTAQIEVAGRGHNLSYQWFRNGSPIAGATAPVLELADANLSDGANYSLRLTNSVGQVTSQSVTLNQAIGAPGLPLEEANATEVPRNGLILWMDANDLDADGKADHLPDDQFVDYWKSKIGDVNATQSDSAQKANIKKLPHNNLTCLSFDGNDFMLDNNVSLPTRCVFLVFETRGNTKYNSIIGNISIGYDWSHKFYGGDFVEGSEGSFRGNGKNGEIGSYNKLGIVFLTRGNDAPNQGLYTSLKLNLNGWEGDFAEILFYNRALSNNERNSVERYLADKWGIQLYADKIAAEQAAYDAAKPSAEPENGLLAYYKFEPVSIEPEKLWDYSGNNHHGNLSGFNDGNPWVDGVDGKSIQFDGVNDSVNLPTISGEHKSYAFWIRGDFPILPTEQSITVWKQDSNSRRRFLVNGGRHFGITINSGNPTRGTVSNASLGKITGWTHLTLTYENEFQFYINGQSVNADSSCPFVTDGNPQLGVGTYQGRLDEFRIYNRTLTPLEIQLLYAETNDEPILRTDIEHNASVGTTYSLSLNADNSPTTYFAQGLPPGLSLNVTTGAISGTPQSAGVYPVTIRASNEHGTSEDIIRLSVYPPSYEPPQGFSSIGEDDVPTNKLALWLDANDVDADGQKDEPSKWQFFYGRLPKWSDKSSSNFDASQDAQTGAHYRENVLNGKSTFRFSSSQPGMLLGANYIFSFGAGEENGLTIITVANSNDPQSNSANRKLIDFGRGETGKAWGVTLRNNGGTFYTPTAHDGKSLDFTINKAPGDFSIGTFRVTFQQQQEVFIDGSLIASTTTNLERLTNDEIASRATPFGNGGPVVIGGHSLGVTDSALFGDIAELLVWKRALTDSERVVVEQYLAQKWGLQHQTYLPPLEQPETGLLGRWTFDEGEGDLVHDVSGNRKHGTMTNMHPVNSWVDGAYGKALEFDGVDDNFTIPNLGDEYRTISMWIHPFNMYSKTLLSLIPDDGEKYVLDWASKGNQDPAGHFYFRSANNSTFLAPGSSRYFNNYSWHHLAIKWDAGNIHYRLFADGIDRGNLGNNVNQTPLFSSGKLEISGYLGKLDDLRIYSRSLTDAEIKNICGDQDEDGLTDIREAEVGTDPNVADTDGDGDSDSAEISAGTSPTDPAENTMSKSLKSGLQVHLKFDETNGSIAYDSSGNNRHSTLNGVGGDGTTWKSGKIGGALRLDGIDDWGQIGYNLAQGDAFTMAMWIKTTSTVSTSPSNYSQGLGILTGPTDTFGMFINSGKFKFWVGPSNSYSSTANVNDNLWYHIVGSRAHIENNRGFIYTALNGSVINHGIVNFSTSTGTTLTLGRTQNGSIYFNGLIDDLRIYNRNLPADQVLSLYQLGL